jgi:hypothetical protein
MEMWLYYGNSGRKITYVRKPFGIEAEKLPVHGTCSVRKPSTDPMQYAYLLIIFDSSVVLRMDALVVRFIGYLI